MITRCGRGSKAGSAMERSDGGQLVHLWRRCLRLRPGIPSCVLLSLNYYSRPSLMSNRARAPLDNLGPRLRKHTATRQPLSCPIQGISSGLGKYYGTSQIMLCKLDSPTSADTFTGPLLLDSYSPPPSSPILLLPFLAFRFLCRLRFFF